MKLMKKPVLSIVVVAGFIVLNSIFMLAVEKSSAASYCDSLKGAAYGLCNAYYHGMRCDSDAPDASSVACDRVADRYTQITGEQLPHESCLTVNPGDPYYTHFEGIGFENSCITDADCNGGVGTGYWGEVCTAETIYTNNTPLPYLPSGTCGCVEGVCVWNDSTCN